MSLGTALNADTPRALWAAGADERVDDGLAVGLRTPAEVRRLADDGRARFFLIFWSMPTVNAGDPSRSEGI